MQSNTKSNEEKYIKVKSSRSVYYLLTEDLSGKSDRWMYSREFYAYLSTKGITIQDWYDKYILNITPDQRPVCPICGKPVEFMSNRRRYREFCSVECQNKFIQTDKSINKKKSDSIKSAYESNPELRRLRSLKRTEQNNLLWSDKSSIYYSRSYRRLKSELGHSIFSRPRSESFKRKKREELLTRLILRPDTVHSLGKHGWYSTSKCSNKDKVFYRSSYELKYLKYLESSSEVLDYSWESERIRYDSGVYVPDVLVKYADRTELIEIKAAWRLTDKNVMAKSKAAEKYASEHGWIYKFITENQLFKDL